MTDENNELILSAMGILTHAGDARLHTKEALKYVQALQFEKADACLKEAKKEITDRNYSGRSTGCAVSILHAVQSCTGHTDDNQQ